MATLHRVQKGRGTKYHSLQSAKTSGPKSENTDIGYSEYGQKYFEGSRSVEVRHRLESSRLGMIIIMSVFLERFSM